MPFVPKGRHNKLPCSLHFVLGDETRHSDPKETWRSSPINQLGKQSTEDGQHLLSRLETLGPAGGSGHQLECAPADLECQRPAGDAQFGQAVLYLERKHLQDAFHLVPVADVSLQRHLFADRFAFAHGLNWTIILATGIMVELPSVLAEQVAQALFSHVLQVSSGLDAQSSELCRRHFAYPEESLDGQGFKESRCLFRGNDGQSIGLVRIGGDPGQKLAVRDPGRASKLRLFPDLPFDFLGEQGSLIQVANGVSLIKVRLVQAERFNEGRICRKIVMICCETARLVK